jgi:CHAT domain-containing protein
LAQFPQQLTFEKPIVGTIEKSERKAFKIRVEKGEFAHIEVQQNRILVLPIIYSSDGKKLFDVRRPGDYLDIRRFTLLAESQAEEFIIQLNGNANNTHGNGFGIRISKKGKIDERNRLRYQAEQILFKIPTLATDFSTNSQTIRDLEKTLEISQKIDDWNFEALVLETLGHYYHQQFRLSLAADYFNQALQIYRRHSFLKGQAAILGSLGGSYLYAGENDKALDALQKSLEIYKDLNHRWGITRCYNYIALLEYRLGQYQKSKESSLKAIEIYGSPTIRSLRGLGDANFALGDYNEALKYYQEAFEMITNSNDRILYNHVLARIGETYSQLNNFEKAILKFEEVIKREEKENKNWSKSDALTGLGIVYYKLGDIAKSLSFLEKSILAHTESENKQGEALSRYWIAKIEFASGNLKKALAEISKAVEISENLRAKISVEELKNSYTATISDYYELHVEILNQLKKQNVKSDYDVQAFYVSERSRARTFLELMKDPRFDFRQSVSPDLLELEKDLQSRINETALIKSKSQQQKNNKSELEKLELELQKLTSELDFVRAKIRKQSPKYAALTQNLPTVTLGELQKNVLDSETVLVEYKLGKERSFVWTISDKSFAMYELPKSEIVESKAKEVYSLLTKRDKEADTKLRELSKLILSPIEKDLQKKRIVFVTEGSLQYIPFSALKVNEKYLVEQSEILNLPSATFLSESRKKETAKVENKKLLAVIADPVFDKNDARVSTTRKVSLAENSLPRLLFSRQEANAIASIVPKNELFVALDFNANKSVATDGDLANYRIVHFATHGFFDSENPKLSGLVFSMLDQNGKPQNGFLRLHEIYNLKLPADLVVLSGCQTALGKDVRGEGLIGLTRGFMYAGALRIAASLWQIDDSATAELMRYFYTAMLTEKLKPAEALRKAQLQMLAQKRWQNPYFWASFTIQGDWR